MEAFHFAGRRGARRAHSDSDGGSQLWAGDLVMKNGGRTHFVLFVEAKQTEA